MPSSEAMEREHTCFTDRCCATCESEVEAGYLDEVVCCRMLHRAEAAEARVAELGAALKDALQYVERDFENQRYDGLGVSYQTRDLRDAIRAALAAPKAGGDGE